MAHLTRRATAIATAAAIVLTGAMAQPAAAVETIDSRYVYRTFYENGQATVRYYRGYADAHRWCLVSVNNRAAYHRWAHHNVTITKNCAWNGRDAYVWQVRYQKKVLAGVV